jgi:predicted dehydrogenase
VDRSVIICGGPDIEARTRAYLQLVGRRRVSVASRIGEFSEAIVDIRGGLASKRLIPVWQQNGCVVVSDGPLARTLAQSQEFLAQGALLIALPSLYDPRYQLILGHVAREVIGDLVTVRIVRLLPAQSPLWDSITFTYGLDPLAVLQALGGPVARIMAREQALRRGRPDTLFAVGRFEGGAIFYLEISAACPHHYRSERIEVVGTEGIMEYDSDLSRPLRLITAEGSTFHNAPYESALPRMLRDYLRRMEDASAMDEHRERAEAAVELLFRAMDSVQAHEAR